jgi:hypothetical protein
MEASRAPRCRKTNNSERRRTAGRGFTIPRRAHAKPPFDAAGLSLLLEHTHSAEMGRHPHLRSTTPPSAANNAPKLARISSVEAIKRNPNSAKKMAMNVRMVIQVGMERHCNTETYMNSRRKHQQPATISYCVERRSVSFAMSFWAAIVRQLMPLLRNRDAWAASTDTTDRPNFTPRLRTAFWPATTRSWMIQRSSSATARKTVNTIFLRYYAYRPSYSKHCKEVPQR